MNSLPNELWLHIGEAQTTVTLVIVGEPDGVLFLEIGSIKTAADFFLHSPATPAEIETAIMVVEDEVTRARTMAAGQQALYTSDASIAELALLAGVPDGADLTLTLDAVERLFDLLAALSQGRPASSAGVPTSPRFAATLLILREFMHHLQFASIRIKNPLAHFPRF